VARSASSSSTSAWPWWCSFAVGLSVATGSGPGAAPLNALAYVLGGILVLPVLVRHRWPRFELIACSVLLLL
jgi:hypothetical protein